MRSVTVTRDMTAPQAAVWQVLADFPKISVWNTGVRASHATSDATPGVGAKRHCDLAPVDYEYVPQGLVGNCFLRYSPDS